MLTRLPPLIPAHTVQVDNVSINYTSAILPNAPFTVVLIHGFGASLETWHDIYPLMSARYSVVRMDLKGSGFSSKPEDDKYAPYDQAQLLVKFLKQLGQTNIVLVGHSLGGGIALLTYFQSMIPSCGISVKGLILIDSAGYSQTLPFFVSAVRNPFMRFFSNLMPPRCRTTFVLNRIIKVKKQITTDRVYRYAFFLNMPGSKYALRQTAKQILPEDVSELTGKFSNVKIPTLIIWGEDDPVIPIENATRFNRDITSSRLVVLPDTGHIPQEERPEEVCVAMDQFLKSLK